MGSDRVHQPQSCIVPLSSAHSQYRTEIQGKLELKNFFSLSMYHAHHYSLQHLVLSGGAKKGEHLPDALRTSEHIFVCLNPVHFNSLSPQMISHPGLITYANTVQGNQISICFSLQSYPQLRLLCHWLLLIQSDRSQVNFHLNPHLFLSTHLKFSLSLYATNGESFLILSQKSCVL